MQRFNLLTLWLGVALLGTIALTSPLFAGLSASINSDNELVIAGTTGQDKLLVEYASSSVEVTDLSNSSVLLNSNIDASDPPALLANLGSDNDELEVQVSGVSNLTGVVNLQSGNDDFVANGGQWEVNGGGGDGLDGIDGIPDDYTTVWTNEEQCSGSDCRPIVVRNSSSKLRIIRTKFVRYDNYWDDDDIVASITAEGNVEDDEQGVLLSSKGGDHWKVYLSRSR